MASAAGGENRIVPILQELLRGRGEQVVCLTLRDVARRLRWKLVRIRAGEGVCHHVYGGTGYRHALIGIPDALDGYGVLLLVYWPLGSRYVRSAPHTVIDCFVILVR